MRSVLPPPCGLSSPFLPGPALRPFLAGPADTGILAVEIEPVVAFQLRRGSSGRRGQTAAVFRPLGAL
jgi:hypothetical protein